MGDQHGARDELVELSAHAPEMHRGRGSVHYCTLARPRCTTVLVGGAEFESATPWMSTKYSNQLN